MDIQTIAEKLICLKDKDARVLKEEYGISPEEKAESAIYKFKIHLTPKDIERTLKEFYDRMFLLNTKESLL